MAPYDLLPLPRQLAFQAGDGFRLGETLTIANPCPGLDTVLGEMAEMLGEKGVVLRPAEEGLASLTLVRSPGHSLGDEGYTLDVTAARISLLAGTEQGLCWGLQTLGQILRQCDGVVRPLHVTDRPDIKLRTAMIDLRFQTFHMDYLCGLIREWSALKLNAVCIEYSDHFPYAGAFEAIRSPLAFTPEEIRRFVDCCKAHYMQIIPVVQSFGHMEYLLRCPDFAHLNENRLDGRFHSQCCPLHPGSLEASKALIRQVYEAHDRPAMLSIGGDEAMHLGECPDCAAYVKAHGKGRLVVSYLNQLIEYTYGLGTLPLVYCDMLLAHPELVEEVSRHCVIGDWDYWTLDTPPTLLKDWHSKGNIAPEEVALLPEPFRGIVERWLMEADGRHFKPFAYLDYLMHMGYPVLAHASTMSVGPSDHFTPNYGVHLPNLIGTADALRRYGGLGMVITAWERFLMDAVSLGIAVGAEQCWNGAGRETAEVRFCRLRYGLADNSAARAMRQLSAPYTLVEKKWPRVYVAERFGRVDIPLREIVGNAEISHNLVSAAEAFAACRAQATRHQVDFDNWLFGAKMKRFWLDIAEIYLLAMEGEDMREALWGMDRQCEGFRSEMIALLAYCMPRQAIEKRFDDAVATYETLKAEIATQSWRVSG